MATAIVTLVPPIVIVPGSGVDAVGDQGAEGDQLAVREVRQARRAEDHRQAERGHRQQQREHQAADRELQGLGRPCRSSAALALPIGKVTKTSESRLRVTFSDTCLGLRSAAPFGRRRLVDLDRVASCRGCRSTCPGSGDVEDAGRVAGAVADDLALVVLDGDLHVRDRRRRLLAGVGQAALDVDGVVVARRGLHAGCGGGVRHRGGRRRAAACQHERRDRETRPASAAMLLGRACMGLLSPVIAGLSQV